jgi:hypothetical protein
MAFHITQVIIDTPEGLQELPYYRRQTRASLLADLAAYAKLREQAVKEKLQAMPELPAPLSQAVRVATAQAPLS